MKRFAFILLICTALPLYATVYTPLTLEQPHLHDARNYVANPDNILSAESVSQINRLCLWLDTNLEVELAVVAINAFDESQYTAYDFSQALFNHWGIGKTGKNTGVLLFLARQSRDIRIHTGGGMEGLLPDAVCAEILDNDIIPYLSQNQWDKGILSGANAITQRLSQNDAQAELLLGYHPKTANTGNLLFGYFAIAFALLIVFAFVAYRHLNYNPHALNNVRYRQAERLWQILLVMAILFPLPMAFFAWWYRHALHRLRTQPITCPECRHSMRLLSEKEEDSYLDRAQQTEEKLKSVDYDVWECPSCLNHLVLPYKNLRSRYTRCPQCGALTYSLQSDVILQSATSTRNGKGEKTYRCNHCGKTKVINYILPMLIITSSASGSRGGGFSGGSFGGGMSFGGGAGGKF